MNIFKEIINLYKDYLQKEKAMANAYKEITEKVQEGITLADQIIDVLKQNKKLKKENAELKEKNNQLTKKCDCLTICNDELQDLLSNDIDTIEQLLEQRTKAKEIIEKVAKMYRYSPIAEKIIEQAEQFLKEIEK